MDYVDYQHLKIAQTFQVRLDTLSKFGKFYYLQTKFKFYRKHKALINNILKAKKKSVNRFIWSIDL